MAVMWRHEFKLKDLISKEDKPPAEVQVIAGTVVDRLGVHRIFGGHQVGLVAAFKVVQNQDEFNDALTELYDAADELRVWVA